MNITTTQPLQGIWTAVDSDTYDGAEDAGDSNTIGHGATEIAAINHLVEQLLDNERRAA